MNLPFAFAKDARDDPPFNLSRWFAIVGLISIAIVGTVSALLLSKFLTDRMLRQEGVLTMEFLQSLVINEKSLRTYFKAEFDGGRVSHEPELETTLKHIATMPDVLRVNIYNLGKVIIWSSDASIIGRAFGPNVQLDSALSGSLVIHGDDDGSEHPKKEEHVDLGHRQDFLLEIYVPVRDAPDGGVIGAIELYKNPQALGEALKTGRLYIFASAAFSGLLLYLALFGLSRRADAIIRSQRKRLVETEILATVGEMGSAVAHGIRNPLAAIRSSAELALEGTHEIALEAAKDIIAEADRLEEWVRTLLGYTRPLPSAPGMVELGSLVSESMEHFTRELEKREISSRIDLSPDLPMAVGDPLLLGRVVHSVLANAVEAVHDGGRIEVAGRALGSEQRVQLTIRDSGPGMTAEQLKRVFTPFYTTKPTGLGLGLALGKRIVERFGGGIVIDSGPGRGTVVSLSMPIDRRKLP
jgi:two-component system sensor histidine kinase HydH